MLELLHQEREPGLARRPVTLRRLLPWSSFAVLVLLLFLLPGRAPVAIPLAVAVLAAANACFLAADLTIDRWLRGHIGHESTPMQFLAEEAPRLLAVAGAIVASLSGYLLWRLAPTGGAKVGLAVVAGLGGCLILAAGVIPLVRKERGQPNPNLAILQRVNPPGCNAHLAEALAFQRICGPRLLLPLVQLWLGAGVILILAGGPFAGLAAWGVAQPGFHLLDFDHWPLSFRIGALGTFAVLSCAIASTMLASFRLTHRMKRVGRLKPGEGWRELGLSIERTGIVPTVGYGAITTLAAMIVVGAGGTLGVVLMSLRLHPAIAIGVAGIVVLVAGWLLIVWPQVYLLALMTRRDCGWMHGFEGSTALVSLEKGDSLRRALWASLFMVSIVFIPAGIVLLLLGVESRELLVAAVLGEKSRRELDEAMRTEESQSRDALSKYHDLLQKGRYLDALNGFQMHLLREPENVPCLRGASLAMLRMGNPRARELVERWESLAPEDPEAKRILAEVTEGRWRDKGDLFLEADARCTQRIGRGV